MSDLCEWVEHYAKYESVWKNKDGDEWSLNEYNERGGGHVIPAPDFEKGFSGIIETFFECRSFLKGYDEPITPALLNSLDDYTPAVYRAIIYAMDKRYRAGMAWASEYWESK